MQLRSVESIRVVQSINSERVEVCGHSSSPFSQSMQRPKLGRGSLTWLSNELPSRSLSCVSDESQFLLQQVDHAIEETPVTSKLPFDVLSGSCPFWRALVWAAWPAMSALKAFGAVRAALPSCGWEANETAKLLTTLARFQGLTSIRVPSRSPATKKWTDSCSSTPLFLELPIFSTWNIRAVLKTPPKSLILQLRLQHKPIQSYLSFQVYSHSNERHFHLRRETTPEHKLADLPLHLRRTVVHVACNRWLA